MQKYLVGGAVRDRLLSLPVHEKDWVVVGSTPEEMLDLGFRQVGKDFPVFLHSETAEEYALARTERKSAKGHTGFQVFSSPEITLQEDLQRRDLTINAIAQDEYGNLTDPYGGLDDIKNRILRHISPAFSEDPLRVLRVARFAARFWHLNFTIAPDTLALMSEISQSGELELLSKERVWRETQSALATANPEIYFLVLLQTGALAKIAAELNSALGNKSGLLHLAKLRHIDNYEFRYVGLVMLASNTDKGFDTNTPQAINHCFACPNNLQELSVLSTRYFLDCHQSLSQNSDDIYDLLHKLDAFRRESRCMNLLACMCKMVTLFDLPDNPSLHFLIELVPLLNSIKLSAQQLETLEGRAIGEALAAARKQLIDEKQKNSRTK